MLLMGVFYTTFNVLLELKVCKLTKSRFDQSSDRHIGATTSILTKQQPSVAISFPMIVAIGALAPQAAKMSKLLSIILMKTISVPAVYPVGGST